MLTTSYTSKVNLKDFNAAAFNRGAGRGKEVLWYLVKITFFLTPLPFPNRFKVMLLKLFGAKAGAGIVIKPRVNIHFPWKLEIGNNVWIGEEVFVLNFENAIIGNNVCISQRAFLCGGNHNYKNPCMPYRNGPITVLDGAWVGANCFIGPDVVIGYDTVITAGSVLTGSAENNSVYRGNPAVYVKSRWNEK